MVNLIIVLAIVASIVIGYKSKLNTGIVAIIFAYLIGCLALGLKPKDIIGMWPTSTMFQIMTITLFYGIGNINGTLEKTARYLLYYMRNYKKLLPFILFLIAVLIGALGAGNFAVVAFLAPLSIMLCHESGTSILSAAVAVNAGSLVGGNFMTSNLGVVFRSLVDKAVTETPLEGFNSFRVSGVHFLVSFLFSVVLLLIFSLLNRRGNVESEALHVEKPEAYTPVQRVTLRLMLIMLAIVLVFPILHMILPDAKLITEINSKVDVSLIACIFAFIALAMKLAPQKEAIARVPWNTIIMVCGVGMLIQVAIKAGTVDLLASWIGSNVPVVVIPVVFALVAGIMSFFSSTIGVVCPTLFPLIPSIALATGLNPLALFVCTLIGSQSTACSPLSASGSMIVGSCTSQEEQNQLFNGLITRAVPVSLSLALVTAAIISLVSRALGA